MNEYKWLSKVESAQTLEELEQEIYENTQTFIPHKVMQWMLKRFYTHPQADQTTLINQLTDELNKTEAERVKWMTVALSLQTKNAPLSCDQIREIYSQNEQLQHKPCEFARLIEKAHGIGV
jgi:hypothetical protein